MSKSKQKGTAAETAVVRWLAANGFPSAERRALHGIADLGDVTGIPGLVIEIKNHKTYKIPAWMAELAAEKANANTEDGFLIVKPVGVGETRVDQWWAIMPLADMARLFRAYGYGDTPDA